MGSCYIDKVISIAKSQLGYEESGSNWTKFARDLDAVKYFNSNKQNVAWCGTFCYWVILKACIPEDRSDSEKKWDALYFTYQPSKDNCACACRYGAQYFRNNKAFYSSPKVGDIAFYGDKGSEYHQGIVEQIINSTQFYAIEGNSNNKVRRVKRNISECSGFGRPRYDGVSPEPAPTPTPTPTPKEEGYPGDFPVRPSRGYFQRGDTGNEVKKLQKLLEWTLPGCLPKYGVDGDIGSETLGAVKKCQAIWGTKVDGFYGANSEKAAKAYKKPVN